MLLSTAAGAGGESVHESGPGLHRPREGGLGQGVQGRQAHRHTLPLDEVWCEEMPELQHHLASKFVQHHLANNSCKTTLQITSCNTTVWSRLAFQPAVCRGENATEARGGATRPPLATIGLGLCRRAKPKDVSRVYLQGGVANRGARGVRVVVVEVVVVVVVQEQSLSSRKSYR